MRVLASLLSAPRRRPWLSLTLRAGGLTLLGLGGTFAARSLSARRHLSAAEQALRRYDFVSARQSVQQALDLQTTNARARLLAVQVARLLDDYAETARLLT